MKTKIVVSGSVIVAIGLLLGTSTQPQNPPKKPPANAQRAGKQITKPNAAAAQNAVQNSDFVEVVQLHPQDLPQTPLRVGINNAMQKGMKEAKLSPDATLTLHTVAGNSSHVAVSGATPTGAASVTPNTSPDLAKGAAANGNSSPNVRPSAKQQPDATKPAAAATGPIPPAINAGIAALVSSRSSLENSGNKWGGHKDKAIKLIDQALTACGQTPDSTGTKSNSADGMAAMQAALTQLTAAQKSFTNAKNAWGGRRDQALALINQALTEVQASIDFSKK